MNTKEPGSAVADFNAFRCPLRKPIGANDATCPGRKRLVFETQHLQ